MWDEYEEGEGKLFKRNDAASSGDEVMVGSREKVWFANYWMKSIIFKYFFPRV